MFEKLIKELKSRDCDYEILRNKYYKIVAVYFVLGNREITVYKGEEEKAKSYLQEIINW